MSEKPTQGTVASRMPQVRKIGWRDIGSALGMGISDFLHAPKYGLFFGAVFAAGGLAIIAFLSFYQAPWMTLPIAIGFPLIGPFVAAGLYEVSRRRGAGEALSWKAILIAIFAQRERQLGWMAFVVLFIFWVWVYLVRIILALFMGFNTPSTISGFVEAVTTTPEGIAFLMTGTLVGAVLALFLFSATVIAMPLLLDSERDFVTAMITSFKAVTTNPMPMLGWGIIVTLLAIAAMVPAFLGLILVFPILGHATWHLYTKVVVRESSA